MSELDQYFCPNKKCKDYGLRCQGNIAVRGNYGKKKSRELLYCRTCGVRFASTQASALFDLHLPAETIRQIAMVIFSFRTKAGIPNPCRDHWRW